MASSLLVPLSPQQAIYHKQEARLGDKHGVWMLYPLDELLAVHMQFRNDNLWSAPPCGRERFIHWAELVARPER
jgi:hypothetical protein